MSQFLKTLQSPRQFSDGENLFEKVFSAARTVVTDEAKNAAGGFIPLPQTGGGSSTPVFSPAPPVPPVVTAPEKSDLTKTVSDYVKGIPPAGYIGGAAAGTATFFATKNIGATFAATVLGTAVSGVIANKIKQHKQGGN